MESLIAFDSHDHHKYCKGRHQHKEHRQYAKDERMKDQASCGRGRSSRRDDDDDMHIREQEGRRIKEIQTDTEPDKVKKEIIQKDKAAKYIMCSLHKQFTIFTNKILPPDKQQSVPGRDTGESQGPVGACTLTILKVGNSVGLWEFVSGATAQNSLRGVGAESKTLFCNKPMG